MKDGSLSPQTRNSIAEGHGDFIPVFFHEIPSLIRRDTLTVDVAMVTVTPPDEHGYCNRQEYPPTTLCRL